jgi:DNA-directed RNA polymerase specialized sigma24 family protein
MSWGDDPDPAELRRLHEALVADEDPTVPARLAELLLPALRRRFASTRMSDPHSVESLIGQSIARYLNEPGRYRPERGPLLAYLWQDVAGDVKNEWDSHTRLRQHESPDSAAVELGTADRNLSVEEEVLDAVDPFDVPLAMLERAWEQLNRFSEQDRQLIMLLGAGVRSTGPYAEVLGIAHLPSHLQAKEVNRHKDRLKKRLEVIRGELRQPG